MNKDLLKVIAGLECCKDEGDNNCRMCPYFRLMVDDDCVGRLLRDTLTILREVEQDGLY